MRFDDYLADVLSKRMICEGDRVTVNGDPGVVISIRAPSTSHIEYLVDHGNGVPYRYVISTHLPPEASPEIRFARD